MPRKIPRLEYALHFFFGAIYGLGVAGSICIVIYRTQDSPFEVPWKWIAILVPLGALIYGWRAMRKGDAFWDERLGR